MADALGVLTLQPNNAETRVEPTGHHAPLQDDPVSWEELEEVARGAVSQHHYTGPAVMYYKVLRENPELGSEFPWIQMHHHSLVHRQVMAGLEQAELTSIRPHSRRFRGVTHTAPTATGKVLSTLIPQATELRCVSMLGMKQRLH